MPDLLHVAIAVIYNEKSEILIQQRSRNVPMAGLWEFPGGKVEHGESPKMALRRELQEELGITLRQAKFFFNFNFQYPDQTICFHVFKVEGFENTPSSNEGQAFHWQAVDDLPLDSMPLANQTIVQSMQLQTQYMIADQDVYAEQLEQQIKKQVSLGIRLIQLRAKSLSKEHYLKLLSKVQEWVADKEVKLILNCPLNWLTAEQWPQSHLSSKELQLAYVKQQLGEKHEYFSASVHNEDEINMANALSIRCVLLGPVLRTPTHSACEPIAWAGFQRLTNMSNWPVFALGGMTADQLTVAQAHAGHGIAGIRAFTE